MAKIEDEVHGIDKRLVKIEAILDRLENNHLVHVESDMQEMKVSIKDVSSMIFKGVIAFFLQLAVVLTGVIAFLASLVWG
jgi:hypothetical protein